MTSRTDGDIERAARAALRGELVVFPTDTVYGIGTRPDDPAATARLFEAKRRPRGLELPVLVPSAEQAELVGELNEAARRLTERIWPGALTIVVHRNPESAGWDLGGNRETVGIRVPAGRTALEILERTGPLAVTSANLSGSPTPETCDEIAAVFGGTVSIVVCGDDELTGMSSTVVDCTGDRPTVLRLGAIDRATLESALVDRQEMG